MENIDVRMKIPKWPVLAPLSQTLQNAMFVKSRIEVIIVALRQMQQVALIQNAKYKPCNLKT